jgi:hypothetical protein
MKDQIKDQIKKVNEMTIPLFDLNCFVNYRQLTFMRKG